MPSQPVRLYRGEVSQDLGKSTNLVSATEPGNTVQEVERKNPISVC